MESQQWVTLQNSVFKGWGGTGLYCFGMAAIPYRDVVLAEGMFDTMGKIPHQTWVILANRPNPFAQGYLRYLIAIQPVS